MVHVTVHLCLSCLSTQSSTPTNDDVGVGVVPGSVSRGSKKGPVLPKALGGSIQVSCHSTHSYAF